MIEIGTVKALRESLDATHIVVFAITPDGEQHVATHGKTRENAREAAVAGNRLKAALGWPKELCKSQPVVRKCKNCAYYKPDFGVHCFNGWSQDGSQGECRYSIENRHTTREEDTCSGFEPK